MRPTKSNQPAQWKQGPAVAPLFFRFRTATRAQRLRPEAARSAYGTDGLHIKPQHNPSARTAVRKAWAASRRSTLAQTARLIHLNFLKRKIQSCLCLHGWRNGVLRRREKKGVAQERKKGAREPNAGCLHDAAPAALSTSASAAHSRLSAAAQGGTAGFEMTRYTRRSGCRPPLPSPPPFSKQWVGIFGGSSIHNGPNQPCAAELRTPQA